MAYTPVVSQHENVIILLCPHCEKSGFYCIERFVEEDAQQDIDRLIAKGFAQKTMPLKAASAIEDCGCFDEEREAQLPAASTFKKREYTLPNTDRPLLSLKRKTA
jgi:hypothetical protein